MSATTWNVDAIIENVWRLDQLADISGLMNAGWPGRDTVSASARASYQQQ